MNMKAKVEKLLKIARGETPQQGMTMVLWRSEKSQLIVNTTPIEGSEVIIIRVVSDRGDNEFFESLDMDALIKQEQAKLKIR
jgi:type II secretory ATPase GspE/PulE/Tfp pilus assembly ATPase PilB-like protein